ncbi:hypothetical protein RD110_21885 [Rhodoferax koreense]|uniref:Antitoxin VbhA domain-containing protein n=1 Tax=Rhodoferax koreensis TaxID=1842727 RepID=A0A1P8K0K8_9BURK|nr:antitoxin VbhA family protein [Rhodoferax koreense]APW39537.1 hypothetical protein RD110_21885 [Rhodoferax koreense]
MGTSTPSIAAEERAKRQKWIDFARGSIGLEGFKITPEHEARAERFVNGDMDLQEFVGARTRKSIAPKP